MAESISVASGASLNNLTAVTFTAIAEDQNQVTAEAGIVDRIASINIASSIVATGDVTLTAAADSNINVTGSATLSASATRSAEVLVNGNISAAQLNISATTSGTVSTTATSSTNNTFVDEASARINGVTINVDSFVMIAQAGTGYTATATNAANIIKGDVTASVENSTVTASDGPATITATGAAVLTVIAPKRLLDVLDPLPVSIEIAAARNELNRNTSAFVSASSTVTATGANVEILALKDTQLSAFSEPISFSPNQPDVPTDSKTFSGTYSINKLLDSTKTYISGLSTVSMR